MKYLGLKTAREVEGKRVITLIDLNNRLVKIPIGAKGVIVGGVRDGKISVEFEKCNCCGVSGYISGLHYSDLKLDVQNETK